LSVSVVGCQGDFHTPKHLAREQENRRSQNFEQISFLQLTLTTARPHSATPELL
jgi:hypothetical protein